jgi:hypothetical protein
MRKVILDTSVLLRWWNQCRSRHRGEITPAHAERWARRLIALHDTDAIATPVFLEVIGGTTSAREGRLMRSYLAPFQCIDEQRIPPQDWRDATRKAQRVPNDRRPRDLGDCLIRAVADRLTYEVLSYDQGFPS